MVETDLSPDFKAEPYWWEAAPRDKRIDKPLPRTADVVIAGSGFTGLSAAFTLAKAGRNVVVLDSEAPGFGASTRNSGFIGIGPLFGFSQLEKRFGVARTAELFAVYEQAFGYVTELIEREQISCGYTKCGRIYWAYNRTQCEKKAKELELLEKHTNVRGYLIPPEEKRREIGSDFYYAGVALPNTGTCHPGLYHRGLMDRVESSGAEIIGWTAVRSIEAERSGFTVATSRGAIAANEVVVASNGYITREVPFLRRRIIPAAAHQAATEPLPANLLERLFPTGRAFLDLRNSFHAWRISPDGTRVLFTGLVGVGPGAPGKRAASLHRDMVEIHPELAGVKFTHYWSGWLGFSFDSLPHVGTHEGVHYALAMNGVGIPMGTYLGHKVALKVLNSPEAVTVLDEMRFPTLPLYTGNAWFVAPLGKFVQWLGRRERPG